MRHKAVFVGAASLLVLAVGAFFAETPTVPDPVEPSQMSVGQVVSRMQQRADELGSMEGVLGYEPVTGGKWSGVPFRFRGPDAFIALTGESIKEPGDTRYVPENTWKIRTSEIWAVREGDWRGRMSRMGSAGTAGDLGQPLNLLLVNLMPAAWFGPIEHDVTLRKDLAKVGDTSYYVLDEVPPRGPDRPMRDPGYWLVRRNAPRRYYVNALTFVCERVVHSTRDIGALMPEDPFAEPVSDAVAEEVTDYAGAALPMRYVRRDLSGGRSRKTAEIVLSGLESASPMADSQFDPWARTPGKPVVVRRPTIGYDDLHALVEAHPEDAGAWLSLVDVCAEGGRPDEAEELLAEADERFAPASEEYTQQSGKLAAEVNRVLTMKELNEAPQFMRIFRRRRERFNGLGDATHASHAARRLQDYRAVNAAAIERAGQIRQEYQLQAEDLRYEGRVEQAERVDAKVQELDKLLQSAQQAQEAIR